MVLQVFQFGIGHPSGRMLSHGFKDILNGHIMSLKLSRHDRPAVQHDRRQIQPGEGHDGSRDRLIATGQGHDRIKQMSTRHKFNRISDDLTADERGLHAFGPHGNSIGHGDGVVFDRSPTGSSDAGLHALGKPAQMEITGHDLCPCVGNTDDRLRQVVVRKAHGFQHRPSRGTSGSHQEIMTLKLDLFFHRSLRSSLLHSRAGC